MPATNLTALRERRSAPLPAGLQLPAVDVRINIDERAWRNWSESSRQVVRVTVLAAADIVAGLLGLATVQLTGEIAGAGPIVGELSLLAMVFCLQPLASSAAGAYASGKARTDIMRIGGGVVGATYLAWIQAQLFLSSGMPTPWGPELYVYAALVITVYAWALRIIVDRAAQAGYAAGILQRRVLFVGTAAQASELSRRCRSTRGGDLRIVGRISTRETDAVVEKLSMAGAPASDVPYLGSLDDLERVLSGTRAAGVVVASDLPFARLESVVGRCFRAGAIVSVVPHALTQFSGAHIEVRQTPVGSFLQLRPVRLDVPQLAVKRTMDIALTLAGLALLWPLLLVVALMIKLDSRGPILFAQTRAGVGGRPFRMLKFRTMRDGADAEKAALASLNESGDTRLFKIKNDPRVTRVGRILRRTSLDELPQIFNVLEGDMSLVGPRPFFPNDLAAYEEHHFERLHVLPGITGLWQVSGRSDVVDFEEVVRLDREYIENWSVMTDLAILLRTVPAAFGRGAY